MKTNKMEIFLWSQVWILKNSILSLKWISYSSTRVKNERQCCLAVGLLCDGAYSQEMGHIWRLEGILVGCWQWFDEHSTPGWELRSVLSATVVMHRSKLSLPHPITSSSYTFSSLTSSKCFNAPAQCLPVCRVPPSETLLTLAPSWRASFPLIPSMNPQSPIVRFSDSLALFSQVEQPADSFQPSPSTQPVAPAARW